MSRKKVWMNDRFINADKAVVPISDRGFLYGDGAFETMRSYAGVVFRLDDHLKRFFDTLKILRISSPYSRIYLKEKIYESLKRNGLENAHLRLTMTRGEGRFGLVYKDIFKPNCIITANEFKGYPDSVYRSGIAACISKLRQNEYSFISRIKSLNYLPYILARLYAKEKGYDEAILMNTHGKVTEAATSNIFLVKRGILITPSLDSGILPGVTRKVVIELAGRMNIRVKERKVDYHRLTRADEVFLTNSVGEIIPVTSIDSRRIARGLVGELTRLTHLSYQKEVIKEVLK